MEHMLIANEMSFGTIDMLVINEKRSNEIRIPLHMVNTVYIANQKAGIDNYILFNNLMVHITGNERNACSYASIKTRWIEEKGYHIITAIYNSHGLYNYAELQK